MKTIIYNDKMLDTVFSEMYRMFNEYKELSVDFGKPHKDKTKVVDFLKKYYIMFLWLG